MIAYNETLDTFYQHINQNIIAEKIQEKLGMKVGEAEQRSFRKSLPAIANALRNTNIPGDVEVALEYKIPLTNRRIDFIIAGADENGKDHIVICELKQWDKVEHTDMNDVVIVEGAEKVHPCWQAYSYGSTISNFNQYVEDNKVEIDTCSFLHNYDPQYKGELCHPIYKDIIDKTIPFISNQYVELSKFVSRFIKTKSKNKLLFEIENGRIKPSKMLVESLASMLSGNPEFELIDEQRIVYSNLLREINLNQNRFSKQVFIVRGGAGTGKSVICIKLLAEMYKKGLNAFYVSKSGYVRENYFAKLTKNVEGYQDFRNLFKGSSAFIEPLEKELDVLIVDEAHRLTEKTKQSWFYRGENQIKEIISATKTSVFFIDETQNIDIKDYGTVEHITEVAKSLGAIVHMDDKYILKSQFRCNGSDDYIAWLDSVLYNKSYEASGVLVDYDIQVFDDIVEMKKAIVEKNNNSVHPSRMLSGDVFKWISMKDKSAIDINIGEFHAQWNKTKAFATDPKSIDEVGCIHTSQGMEFEYTGLIVADDLYFDGVAVRTDYTRHPEGAAEFRRPHARKPNPADSVIIDRIIRNTYKVLFTRGQKGTYLYVMNPELRAYLKEKINELKKVS